MVSTICVKISYKGLTRNIVCNEKFQYDDLLKTVMDKFNIENSWKLAIEFYDEQGHKYNKDTFEYLLLLFPNPQKIFFVRLDTTKMLNLSTAEDAHSVLMDSNEHLPFVMTKLNNRETTEPDTYCDAVPVRRQNCFLGVFPGSTSTQQPSPPSIQNHPDYLSIEVTKRLYVSKQSPPKKKHLNNPNAFKRSLRI